MSKRLLAAVATVVAAGGAVSVLPVAAAPVDNATTRLNFAAADRDKDGFVTEAEVASDMATAFNGLDANRDRALEPGELGPHDAAAFGGIDADKNGRLSFDEVVAAKMRGLAAFDGDGDARFSFDEIRRFDASR